VRGENTSWLLAFSLLKHEIRGCATLNQKKALENTSQILHMTLYYNPIILLNNILSYSYIIMIICTAVFDN